MTLPSSDPFQISGQTALVTGASSGFGAHFARVLAAEGCKVVIAARRKERLDALAAEINEAGGQALAVEMDVTSPQSVAEAFASAEAALGVPTIVVNNAGVAKPANFESLTEEDWSFVMDTNFKGVRLVAKEAIAHMTRTGVGGSIVNIASMLGLGAQPQQAAYTASKGAVIQLTRTLALECFRKDIRVNAICPGYICTEMNEEFFSSDQGRAYIARTPARRLGELDELTLPLLMLASPRSGFTTGTALPVDGGHSVRLI